jgi:NADPH-dependent glutamate synthase beta subunit-like oxidoreductase/CO/xanthine dehydrogenase FAD-binding subunit
MKPFIHYDAKTVADAIQKLAECKHSKIIAGGTDCLGVLKNRLLPTYPEAIVNIKTIPGLDAIAEDDQGLKIGATARLADIAENSIVKGAYGILAEAAKSVATPQIRGMATIGGNLCQDLRCWYYRHPHQIGGRILCLRKGGKICNALAGDNRYHSIFGGARINAPSCASDCPVQTNIPLCLDKFRQGEFMEATKLWLGSNPLPAITGRVCPAFCEPGCNRAEFDESVAIKTIERFLGDYALERMTEVYLPPVTDSGKNIAVVGAGPAGLAAAYFLRKSGHRVSVLERRQEAGGMLLYSIPPYRLPKDVVRRQTQALAGMGIKFEFGVIAGQDVTVTELMAQFDAVFLAAGAWKERPLGIQGEENVLSGLDFLNKVNNGVKDIPGRRVAVLGGGNVAIDVARTLLRLGAEPVVLYRRSAAEMPAIRDEVEKAQEEGIKFEFLTLPTQVSRTDGRISLKCVRMELGSPDASGRPRPVPIPDSEFTATFDAAIKAVGEEPDTALLPAEFLKQMLKKSPSAYRLGKNLFAGGDFVTGPSAVAQAVAAGREAAGLMEQSLASRRLFPEVIERAEPCFRAPSISMANRASIPELPVGERVQSIDWEDTPDLSLGEVEREAGRCFNCGCLAVSPSDIGVVLLALDARIVTTRRTLDIKSFFTTSGLGSTALDADELVTEIQIPRPAQGAKQTFRKFTLRKALDFAIVSVASVITLEDGVCRDAKIALGAVAPTPLRATAAEEVLRGKIIDSAGAKAAAKAAVAEAAPLAGNGYKVEIAKALVRRAILA